MQRIHALARGVPRRINLLCDRALLGAYASGKPQVDVAIVDKAAAEVAGEMPPRRAGGPMRGAARMRIAAALGLGVRAGRGAVRAGLLAWTQCVRRRHGRRPVQQQAGR